MKNAQIISLATAELVAEGKLRLDGGIPEEIHTFEGWKERGYGVRKGEKSDIRITIWKHGTKKNQGQGRQRERKVFHVPERIRIFPPLTGGRDKHKKSVGESVSSTGKTKRKEKEYTS